MCAPPEISVEISDIKLWIYMFEIYICISIYTLTREREREREKSLKNQTPQTVVVNISSKLKF